MGETNGNRRTTAWTARGLAALALVVAAAACGGGGSTSKSTTTQPVSSSSSTAVSATSGPATTTPGGSSTTAAAGAATCTAKPAGNVVINGDAESGPLVSDASSSVTPQGWAVTGGFTAAAWDNPADLPHASDPGPTDRGKGLFAGGPDNETSSATQTDPLPTGAAGAAFTLSACLGGFASQDDGIVVTAQFLDASGAPVGTRASVGPVTAADRQDATALLARSAKGTVPAGATSVKVTMTSTRTEGSYDDGYADDVALVVTGTG
jgi:hypothetical protein